jgi:hypothetical protein
MLLQIIIFHTEADFEQGGNIHVVGSERIHRA